jgi:hypothetical protein
MRVVGGVLIGIAFAVGVLYAALDTRGLDGAKQSLSQLTDTVAR